MSSSRAAPSQGRASLESDVIGLALLARQQQEIIEHLRRESVVLSRSHVTLCERVYELEQQNAALKAHLSPPPGRERGLNAIVAQLGEWEGD